MCNKEKYLERNAPELFGLTSCRLTETFVISGHTPITLKRSVSIESEASNYNTVERLLHGYSRQFATEHYLG